MMNLLFTSAGRRNYLLSYFRDALGGNGRILAADCCEYAACLQEADEAFVVPRVTEPGYIDYLLSRCIEHDIGMVVSLNDHELPILAEQRARFEDAGIRLLVSDPQVISLAADKLATVHFARRLGIDTPVTYSTLEAAMTGLDHGEAAFPLFIKPRWGTASLGIECVGDREELRLAWQLGLRRLPALGLSGGGGVQDQLLIQSRLTGHEYGLDIINDLDGKYRATFVKRKLAMRAGETDRAITELRPDLIELGRRIGCSLGHVGNLDCDVFADGDRLFLLEINPRFGGGYPFSASAGADVPGALLAWAAGRTAPSGWANIRDGVASSKCDRLVSVTEGRVRPLGHAASEPPDVAMLQDGPA